MTEIPPDARIYHCILYRDETPPLMPPRPSKWGNHAAQLAVLEEPGFMSTIRRAKSPGYDVTGSFVAYAPPLIGESTLTVPVEQGLPRFARLCRAQLSCVFSWINNPDSLLSNEGLSAAITAEGDPESKYELSAILEWSKRVNWAVGEIVKGIPSFPYVRKSLQRIQGQADLAVVSAPLFEVLLREWAEHDIESDTALISGQEMGGKRKHIAALGDRLHS